MEKLEHYKHKFVYLFERNGYVVFGRIDKVKHGIVKVKYGFEFNPCCDFYGLPFRKLYVGAYEITEFLLPFYTWGGDSKSSPQEMLKFIRKDMNALRPND